MRKRYIDKPNKWLDSKYEYQCDSIEAIIEKIKRNERLWILTILKRYEKKWDNMHYKKRCG